MSVVGYRDGSISFSRDRQGDTVSGIVDVRGVADELTANAEATAFLPEFYGGPSGDIPLSNVTADHTGAGVWECSFTYSEEEAEEPEKPDIGDIEWELQPNVVTVTEYNAITELTYRKGQAPVANLFNKVIGVQQTDPPTGVEKQYATGAYVETHYIDPGDWNIATALEWFDRITLVNNNPYHGFQERELLFMGATAQITKGITILPVTLTWAYSKSEQALQVGEIQNIDKPGWDYLWAQYIKVEKEEFAVRDPQSVTVNGIYQEEDFNAWGIGNPHD